MRRSLSRIHQLIDEAATRTPDAAALVHGEHSMTYLDLRDHCRRFAAGAMRAGLLPGARVAVFLPKQLETVVALFGTSVAGGTFVPINPVLKPAQSAHAIGDCGASLLITSRQRWTDLEDVLARREDLAGVVLVDDDVASSDAANSDGPTIVAWSEFLDATPAPGHRRIDRDMAAILYTSGSTGKPKGVVLSHRNLLGGAESVSTYLINSPEDRILAVLPLSFDAGLSQLTTAFNVGATAVLMDYLLPQDVLRAVARYAITGLAAVPPLWNRLVQLEWPSEAARSLRYITNTGGTLPETTIRQLTKLLPSTDLFLMYGLTEAFRSTYLPPTEVARIPTSIGRAIPNAQVLVVNSEGAECAPGEPGELVHRGELVTMGYWKDPEATAQVFRPAPGSDAGLPIAELAVWSGDQVVRDDEGYLYFVARQDDLIKTSGYRVSPTDIESLAHASGAVAEAAAVGLPHPMLGQGILLLVTAAPGAEDVPARLGEQFRAELPGYMQPLQIQLRDQLPHNQNGKVDRRSLAAEYRELFTETS